MPASVQIKPLNDLQKTWGTSAQAQFCTGLHTCLRECAAGVFLTCGWLLWLWRCSCCQRRQWITFTRNHSQVVTLHLSSPYQTDIQTQKKKGHQRIKAQYLCQGDREERKTMPSSKPLSKSFAKLIITSKRDN